MSTKSTEFTVKLDGISLPEDKQKEIAAAINQLVIAKLGSLELASSKAAGHSLVYQGIINGGILYNVQAAALQGLLKETFKQPTVGGAIILAH